MGVSFPGGNCLGGKLFRGDYPEGKSPEGSFLGENFIGGSCLGVVDQGGTSWANFSGEKYGVQLTWRNFMGSNCPRGSCPGGNVWIPKFITQCFLTVACLICLDSQFNSVSKLILYSAEIGIIVIINALHFL